MEHDVVRCGFTWSTFTSEKGRRIEHVHRCDRPAGHETTWHACRSDGGTSHTIERRAALRGSAA